LEGRGKAAPSKEQMRSLDERLKAENDELRLRLAEMEGQATVLDACAEAIAETVREPVVVIDASLHVRYANLAFCDLFRTRPEKVRGRPIHGLDEAVWNLPQLHASLKRILAHPGGHQDCEIECDVAGLGRRILLCNGRRMPGNPGPTIIAMEDATERLRQQKDLVAINEALRRETPERERVERALRDSERRYRLLLQSLREYAVFMLDPEGCITSWNVGIERMVGCGAGEVIGKPFADFSPGDDAAGCKPAELLRVAEQNGRCEEQAWYVRKDGSRFWANLRINALRDENGQMQGFAVVIRNDTERRNSDERMAQLSNRMLTLRDEERRRIGQELHDRTAQLLAAVAMNLSLVQRTTQGLHENAQQALQESTELIDQCSREIRTLSYLLHPPFLDEVGLESAVRWYAEGFARRSGIEVEIDVPPGLGRLARNVETALFRIVQECLTNVHHHSGGSTAHIEIVAAPDAVRLRVADDGHGSEGLARIDDYVPIGVGVAGMRERAQQLGGSIKFFSSDRGTVVEVTVPLPAPESPT